jgi:hypothetical protein
MPSTIVVNFAHPLSEVAQQQLRDQLGEIRIETVRVQLDMSAPLAPQVEALVAEARLTSEEWATSPILVVLPGLAVAASLVLTAIHGRRGCFPRVLHLDRMPDGVFQVGELIDLADARDTARQAR